MPNERISQLLGDPQFQQLDSAGKRKTLVGVTGDQRFSTLTDDGLDSFVQRLSSSEQRAIQALPNTTLQARETLARPIEKAAEPTPFQIYSEGTLGTRHPITEMAAALAAPFDLLTTGRELKRAAKGLFYDLPKAIITRPQE